MQNKYLFLTFIVYEVNCHHRDQVQSSRYLPRDHEISSILRGNGAQAPCWMGKKVPKCHPGKYEGVFPLCGRRAAFIGLHQSLWSFFPSSAVQYPPSEPCPALPTDSRVSPAAVNILSEEWSFLVLALLSLSWYSLYICSLWELQLGVN